MDRSATAQDTEHLISAVDQASRDLREAVIAADHSRAERASSRYVGALQKLWEALPDQERAASVIPARASELLAWAREMAIIQRALTADQLSVLQKASRYQNATGSYIGLQVKG